MCRIMYIMAHSVCGRFLIYSNKMARNAGSAAITSEPKPLRQRSQWPLLTIQAGGNKNKNPTATNELGLFHSLTAPETAFPRKSLTLSFVIATPLPSRPSSSSTTRATTPAKTQNAMPCSPRPVTMSSESQAFRDGNRRQNRSPVAGSNAQAPPLVQRGCPPLPSARG